MLNKKLEKRLLKIYRQDLEWKEKGDQYAEKAKREGKILWYFDQRIHYRLPDTCWALERYEEARRWCEHNAQIYIERGEWVSANIPDYPYEDPFEAATFVKAGMMERGREFLRRACKYESGQRGGAVALRYLGLHAAQVGMRDLSHHARAFIPVLLKGVERVKPEEKRRAKELIHSEPAEVAFLLGDYEQCALELEKVFEGERLLREVGEPLYDDRGEEAVFATAWGLRAILDILEGKGEREALFKQAVSHLEEAMLVACKAGEHKLTYFLRLYTLMGLDILEGRAPNPNPFAGDGCPPDGAVGRACRVVK